MAACSYGCGETAIQDADVCESCATLFAQSRTRPYTPPEPRMSIQEAANELRACAGAVDAALGPVAAIGSQVEEIKARAIGALGETARAQSVMEAVEGVTTSREDLQGALLYLQSELTAAANHHSQG
jgi:hypothetical protein